MQLNVLSGQVAAAHEPTHLLVLGHLNGLTPLAHIVQSLMQVFEESQPKVVPAHEEQLATQVPLDAQK
jgi:hypothetical protein